jgi:hypothetical protein
MADRPARGPIEQMAQRIAALEAAIIDLSTKPLVVPVVNADPGTDYPGNIWIYPDGKVNVRLKDGTVKTSSFGAVSAPTASNPTPPAQPITRSSLWTAQWGQAYRSSGGFTGSDNSKLQMGSTGDSYNGRQRSLIGFDYASIQSTLSGSKISRVQFWLYNWHTWYYNGGTYWAGMHNNTVKPGSWGGTIGRDFVSSFHVPNTGPGWYDLATEFGDKLRDGTAKGVTLQAPNDDRTYYGYAAGGPGTAGNQMPQILITYVK